MFSIFFFYIVDITVSIYISNLRHGMQRGPRSPPEKLGPPKELGPPWSKSIIAPSFPN